MTAVIVHRTFDAFPVSEFFQMLHEKIRLKCIRMIVVEFFTLLKRQVIMAFIIIVVVQHRNLIAETMLSPVCKGRFSGTGPSRNSNHNAIHFFLPPLLLVFFTSFAYVVLEFLYILWYIVFTTTTGCRQRLQAEQMNR